MTASLYQRGSAAGTIVAAGRREVVPEATAVVTNGFSQVVLELGLTAEPRSDMEDRRRRGGRVQLHAISGSLPEVGRAVEEVLRLEGTRGVDPQLLERQLQGAGTDVLGIQIDDRQHDVGAVRGSLRIGDEPIVADGVELQATVGLQGPVLVPDAIDLADERGQAVRPIDIPVSELVLL